jgi:hypothetical protein
LKRKGFNDDGKMYVAVGNTFEIKDDLKAAGAKYSFFGWHFDCDKKPAQFDTIEICWQNVLHANAVEELLWNEKDDIIQTIKDKTPVTESLEKSVSQYYGEVGKRYDLHLKVENTFIIENNDTDYTAGYGSQYGFMYQNFYIHQLVDSQSNVFIWKTSHALQDQAWYDVRGTVKEHSEYKNVPQTVLTRCKTTPIQAQAQA